MRESLPNGRRTSESRIGAATQHAETTGRHDRRVHESLVLSRVLRVSGTSTRSLERAVRAGRLVRIRPGAAVPAEIWMALSSQDRHRLAMDALAATARSRPVFAAESAAALHGIPVVGGWPVHPRVAASLQRSRRPRVGTSGRWEAVADEEIVDVDHVVRVHGVPFAELRAQVSARRPFPGVQKVDAALRVASGLAESVLESLSLVRIHQLGFPRPEQQVEVDVGGARYRVDFLWRAEGVVGEADGRSKYDEAPAAAVWNEKLREDDLRSAAPGFARWGWDEAWSGAPLAVRLERAGLTPDPRNASKYAFRMRD